MTPEQKAEQRLELFDEIMDEHGSGSVLGRALESRGLSQARIREIVGQ